MDLISMKNYVLKIQQSEDYKNWKQETDEWFNKCVNYAEFINQPLELGMFVPCVDNEIFNYSMHGNKEQFEQAKERCLFEGFEFQDANEDYPAPFICLGDDVTLYPEIFDKNDTIENLVYYSEFIKLTPTAIKQFNL